MHFQNSPDPTRPVKKTGGDMLKLLRENGKPVSVCVRHGKFHDWIRVDREWLHRSLVETSEDGLRTRFPYKVEVGADGEIFLH